VKGGFELLNVPRIARCTPDYIQLKLPVGEGAKRFEENMEALIRVQAANKTKLAKFPLYDTVSIRALPILSLLLTQGLPAYRDTFIRNAVSQQQRPDPSRNSYPVTSDIHQSLPTLFLFPYLTGNAKHGPDLPYRDKISEARQALNYRAEIFSHGKPLALEHALRAAA
jgi:hypothetical protein